MLTTLGSTSSESSPFGSSPCLWAGCACTIAFTSEGACAGLILVVCTVHEFVTALVGLKESDFCNNVYIYIYIYIGVRGSPERDILSLGAMGTGAWLISGVVRVTARAYFVFF